MNIHFLLDISVIWDVKDPIFSGSLEYEMPNMIWYESKLWDGHKCLKMAEINENEQKMNQFLFAFVKILKWLKEGAHISKN